MITTCSKCAKSYEAGSEEQAYEADRLCPSCVDWPMKCPDCGAGPVYSKTITDTFQYGPDPDGVKLSCQVPLRTCQACGFEYLDHETEKAHDAAVAAHLQSVNNRTTEKA